jgi:hypothetical protein
MEAQHRGVQLSARGIGGEIVAHRKSPPAFGDRPQAWIDLGAPRRRHRLDDRRRHRHRLDDRRRHRPPDRADDIERALDRRIGLLDDAASISGSSAATYPSPWPSRGENATRSPRTPSSRRALKSGAGVFQAAISRASGCAITDSISAASATVRVIGP